MADAGPSRAGNPIVDGWYADPEAITIGQDVWVFPTTSARYNEQMYFDAFSSRDGSHWTRHPRVLEASNISWARRALWAPVLAQHQGRYFLFFAANDIQNNTQEGGIGIAVADAPADRFKDYLGKPLIDRFYNGAQPIDQCVFRDRDGRHYLIYGGWGHCNIALLSEDFKQVLPLEDGQLFREITPKGYVEGPFMCVRNAKYYFMWSEGGWTGPDYRVAYAMADSIRGPFTRIGTILEQDPAIATGAGHHSVMKLPGRDEYAIVYHRRPLGETDRDHRVVCIDRLEFDEHGYIKPVRMTFEGVRFGR